MSQITVSVILPTCNRADLLQRCLQSLTSQNFPAEDFEIIVVDDGSTDGTRDLMENYKTECDRPLIRYFYQSRGGPGAARNGGIRMAQGDILAFTEDDIVVDKNWLKLALPYFDNQTVGGVEGLTLEEGGGRLLSLPSRYHGFIPCNMFYRRGVLEKLGGFDPQFYDPKQRLYFREDGDLGFRVMKAGWKIIFADDVCVHHPRLFQKTSDITQFLRRYFFDPLLYKKHPGHYKRMIEVKKMGPLTIRRPIYLLSLVNVLSLLLSFVYVVYPSSLLLPSIPVYIISLAGIIYKFTFPDFYLIKKNGFLPVVFAAIRAPFVYLFWLVKGCIHFRSFPWS
jgi:glycosyltransferase involved in cell wall biosynthesis